jgi:hypothetical protein
MSPASNFASAHCRVNPLQCRPMSTSDAVVPVADRVAAEVRAPANAEVEPASDPVSEVCDDVSDVASVIACGGDAGPSDERFYAALGEITDFRDVMDLTRHAQPPASSLIVSTDVASSTKAIEAGRYKDVNALGVASIVALCNAMSDIELPFMFGGDGATLLVPASRRVAAERALRGVRSLAQSAFGMTLRASVVPLAELLEDGHVARVARFRASEHIRLAMFSGSAFSQAERWLKDPSRAPRYEVSVDGESAANFEGFECRWRPLASQRGHTVSLIVRALAPTEPERTQTYKNLLHAFDRIVDADACHPVKLNELELEGWLGDFSVEARVRAGGASGPGYSAARRSARKQTFVGRLLTASGLAAGGFDGKLYKRDLVKNCDYRKFDDTLRMVVDLNVAEIYRLESRLSAEHRAGRLAYGLHRSNAALITCLVRSYSGSHVHFVDGSDGGYALAAQELKAQLEELAKKEPTRKR